MFPWHVQWEEAYVIFRCGSSNRTPFWNDCHIGHIEKLLSDRLAPCQLQSSLVHLQVCISSWRNPLCASRSSEGWMGWPSSWLPRFPCTWCPVWRRRLSQLWGRTGKPSPGCSAPGRRPSTWSPEWSQFHQQWPFWFTSELNQICCCQKEKTCHFFWDANCELYFVHYTSYQLISLISPTSLPHVINHHHRTVWFSYVQHNKLCISFKCEQVNLNSLLFGTPLLISKNEDFTKIGGIE